MDFIQRFGSAAPAEGPKYRQLRDILLAALDAGYWKPGDRFPTETELAEGTPYSLGTVQKALQSLVADGIIVRRRGRGSFVARARRPMEEPWHCRFLDEVSGELMPIYPRVARKAVVPADPVVQAALELDGAEVLEIDRIISVGDRFEVDSRFLLDPAKASRLIEAPEDALDGINFRSLLLEEFRLPVVDIEQTFRIEPLPKLSCERLGLSARTIGLHVEATAFTIGRRPLYFHELFVPPNNCRLVVDRFGQNVSG